MKLYYPKSEDVIDYYNGPLTYTTTDENGLLYFCYLRDEDEYFVCRIESKSDLSALLNGSQDIRTFLKTHIDMIYNIETDTVTSIDITDDIHDDYIADPGVFF